MAGSGGSLLRTTCSLFVRPPVHHLLPFVPPLPRCTTCPPSCPLSSRQVHHDGQAKYVGRLSRQAAAVGADIVTTWQQQCVASKVAQRVSLVCMFVC